MQLEKVSTYQIFALFFATLFSTLGVLYPPSAAGINGWIASLLAIVYDMLIFAIVYIVYKKAPGKSILELLDGHPLIKLIFSLILLFYLTTLNSLTVTDLRELIEVYLLPETPVTVVLISALLIASLAARGGVEIIARTSEWMLPILTLVMIFLISTLSPELELERLTPILEEGWGPVILASLHTFDFIGFVFVALLLAPNLNNSSSGKKGVLFSIIAIGIGLLAQSIVVVGTFGEQLTTQYIFPVVEVTKYSEVTEVLSRLDPLLISMWVPAILIKIALILWLSSVVTATAFKLKEKKPFVTVFAFLAMVLSLVMFPNIIFLLEWGPGIWALFAITVQVILPLLLLPLILLSKNKHPKPTE